LPVNHLEGHIYAAWLEHRRQPEFPALALIASGGHSDVVLMEGHGQYRRLGETVDDAAGEAFDKVARLLGLGFPGGPAIESLASEAAAPAGRLPRARLERPYDFSFSGLKAKVQRIVRGEEGAAPPPAALAAAFQESVVDSLVTKALLAAKIDRNGGLVAFPPTKLARRKWQMLRLVFGCRYAAFKIRFPAFLRRRRADRLMQVAHGAVARGQRQASEDGLDAADALFGAQGRKPGQDGVRDDFDRAAAPDEPGDGERGDERGDRSSLKARTFGQ